MHAERLRIHRSTQDDEDERAFDSAAEFSSFVEKYKADVSKSAPPPHEVVASALESKYVSKYVTNLFEHFYTSGVLFDDVYRGMEVFEPNVKVAIRDAYVKFVNEKYHNIYPTLAEPVYPTFTEPVYPTFTEPVYPTFTEPVYPTFTELVHPTLAELLSTRSKDKGTAEVVGVQLAPKVWSNQDRNAVWLSWLQHRAHPANVLKLLKLDEAGDDLLENMHMFRWIAYVMKFKDMHPNNPTTIWLLL
ncbi:unnamed protein product [Peronospora destructor]|uniref:RxLR effector PexRD54 WY domain-containing protein n=1 Tax=Peronospora destructor TaxID=86335 RepID=A0AAV0UWR9_9STRA|nr:unnamed protein product [Peronospora destructor]